MGNDSKTKMLEVLKDMNVTMTDDLARNPSTVTGIFLEEHGIDPKFILENIILIQTMNENEAIRNSVAAFCLSGRPLSS
jgi:hypothetical protein